MAQIKVRVRNDVGDLGTHPKLGQLVPGTEVTIEDVDFGAGLFERPFPEWLSPHEKADKDRAAAEGLKVGDFEPPPAEPEKAENVAVALKSVPAEPVPIKSVSASDAVDVKEP